MNKAIFHKSDLYITDNSVELLQAGDGSIHIIREYSSVVKSMTELLQQENPAVPDIRMQSDKSVNEANPVIVVIAVTYNCRNRCDFPCASNSMAGINSRDIPANEIRRMTDLLYNKHRPHVIIFSGGDPLLRKDIFRHIEYAARKGLKTGIITNGIKCSEMDFVKRLSDSGLHSARINLESHDEFIHNTITGNLESYKKSVSGIHNLIKSGINTYTNTSICRWNMDQLLPLAKFVHSEFNTGCISMSMKHVHDEKESQKNNIPEYPIISSHLNHVISFCSKSSVKFILNLASADYFHKKKYFNNKKAESNPFHPGNFPELLNFKKHKKNIDKYEAVWKYFSENQKEGC